MTSDQTTGSVQTVRLYNQDAYLKVFTAKVISCEPADDLFAVTLDQTAFYPEGGGQPADLGFLDGHPILDVRERPDGLWHLLAAPLTVGATVEGKIDWDLRFARMQHHSGEHVISGLVRQLYGFDNVGFRMGSEGVTIDFNGVLTEAMLDDLIVRANKVIYQNLPVTTTYPAADVLANLDYRSKKMLTGEIRIVTIPGQDVCACCGTHVRQTGEIGIIQFTQSEKYKGGTRLTMLCGLEAVHDYQAKLRSIRALSSKLSVKPDVILEAADRLTQDLDQASRHNQVLKKRLWEYQAAAVPVEDGRAIWWLQENLSGEDLRQCCQILSPRAPLAMVLAQNGDDILYAIKSDSIDLKPLSVDFNRQFNGRGGGQASYVQGKIQGDSEAVLTYLMQNVCLG